MKAYLEANPEFERFSFRYSLDKWSRRDDRKMEQVYGLTTSNGEG